MIMRECPQKSALNEVKLTAVVNTIKVWTHNATLCATLWQQSIISGVDNLYNYVRNKQAILMVQLPSHHKPKWQREKLLPLCFLLLSEETEKQRKLAEVHLGERLGCKRVGGINSIMKALPIVCNVVWSRYTVQLLCAMLREAATRCNCCLQCCWNRTRFYSCSIACNIVHNDFRGGHSAISHVGCKLSHTMLHRHMSAP